jgi:dUTP pyrophosphatase
MSSKWGDENEECDNTAQVEYARGMLLARIIYDTDNKKSSQIEVRTFSSERDTIPEIINIFDPSASRIAVYNVKPQHSADYRFALSMCREDFIKKVAPSDIKASHALFHGIFDAVSNIRLSDSDPKIILLIPDSVYDIFASIINTLFGNTLKITRNEYIIENRDEIILWRDKLYFSDSGENYNYSVTKENQISSYLANNTMKKMHHNTKSQTKYTPHIKDPHWKQKNYSYDTEIVKMHNNAIIPTYATENSSGADISVIRYIETKNNVQFYGCGFSIQPPKGFYYELYVRSSLASKEGYTLANNVGIIDADYRGELIIQLTRIDGTNTHITEFPKKIAQLILRPLVQSTFSQVNTHSENNTERGTGGFGSTDSKYRSHGKNNY